MKQRRQRVVTVRVCYRSWWSGRRAAEGAIVPYFDITKSVVVVFCVELVRPRIVIIIMGHRRHIR